MTRSNHSSWSSFESFVSAQPQCHLLPSASPPTRRSRASDPSRQHLALQSSLTVTSSPLSVQDTPDTSFLWPSTSGVPDWYIGMVSSSFPDRLVVEFVRRRLERGVRKRGVRGRGGSPASFSSLLFACCAGEEWRNFSSVGKRTAH